jgi:hypothetical protein
LVAVNIGRASSSTSGGASIVARLKVRQRSGEPGYPVVERVYGQRVKGALDYVLVVILGCIIVAALVLVAIVVLEGSPP